MEQASNFIKQIFGEKSLYDILEVQKSASEEQIKKAYRKLALKHHPDRGGDAEKFKALSLVHSILSDSSKRSVYDQTGDLDTEDVSDEATFWYDYFRKLFPKLTTKVSDVELGLYCSILTNI